METRNIIPTTRRGDVTFHADGRIDLTAHVTKSLDLHDGDVINIIESGEVFPEHYLYRARDATETIGRHACVCHSAKPGVNYLRVFNRSMARYVLHLCQCPDQVSLRVGDLTELQGHLKALPIIIPPNITRPS